MVNITSASNSRYKLFKSLLQKKGRQETGLFCVEGIKSVNDALNSPYEVECLIVCEGFSKIPDCTSPVYVLAKPLFEKLCDTKTPQGITAVLKMKANQAFIPKAGGAYVYCDGVSDPGNAGTIVRTADAAGFNGVIFSAGSVDIYAPKTVRASMGSFFNIEIITEKTAEDLKEYIDAGFEAIGGVLSDKTVDFKDVDYKKPLIIVLGNEANGISREVLSLCRHVKIPIFGKAESLNVSVAAGILMYEWSRNNLT